MAATVLGVSLTIPMSADAQTVRPGTTVGETCAIYKELPGPSEIIHYWQCSDGGTVKFVTYFAADGEGFQYTEFHDANGVLIESRFGRAPNEGSSIIPLADSVAP